MIGVITETWSLRKLVTLSGYRNVVTMDCPPIALVHGGADDARIVKNGVAAYYVAEKDLPADEAERARQLLERLHRLGDWAAGEIVERHRRDVERLASGYYDTKPRLSVHQMFVRRHVKRHPCSLVEDIAESVGLSISEVHALADELCRRGILVASGVNEIRYELSPSEQERYQDLSAPEANDVL